MIEIVNWSEQFENADTRKRQRLGWYLTPSGCDSKGFRVLVRRHGKDGLAAFGVFNALCQLMATFDKDRRGRFVNSDGSGMEPADLWEMTGIQPADGQQALALLVEVGWLTVGSATYLPPICQSHPGFVKGEGEGEGEGKGEGEEGACGPVRAPVAENAKEEGNWTRGDTLKAEEVRARISKLAHGWDKPAVWTYTEEQALMGSLEAFRSMSSEEWTALARWVSRKRQEGAWPRTRSQLCEHLADCLQQALGKNAAPGKKLAPSTTRRGGDPVKAAETIATMERAYEIEEKRRRKEAEK